MCEASRQAVARSGSSNLRMWSKRTMHCISILYFILERRHTNVISVEHGFHKTVKGITIWTKSKQAIQILQVKKWIFTQETKSERHMSICGLCHQQRWLEDIKKRFKI